MEALDAQLCACLDVNNQARRAAEEQLKALSASPQIVPELLARIQGAPDAQVRQLAAVLLRKRVSRHWLQLSPEGKRHTQSVLLQQVAAEPNHAVRRAVADVVSVAAKLSVFPLPAMVSAPPAQQEQQPSLQWPELLGFLQQCSGSASHEHREVALVLFRALAENIGEHLVPSLQDLTVLVGRGLMDPHKSVRYAALPAMLALGQLITEQTAPQPESVAAFQQLVGLLLQATSKSLQEGGGEELSIQACQVLVELIESPAPLLQPHLPNIIAFCMEVALQRGLELETRERALDVLHWVAKYKPKQLTKDKNMIRQVVSALCTMCCEPDPPDHDEASDGPAPRTLASQALDALACNCASMHIHPQVLSFAKQASQAAEEEFRLGALTALAVVAEGCAEPLRRRLGEAMPLALAGLRDPSQKVRGAAAFALGQFSEHLQPEVVEHYEAVLPALFGIIQLGPEQSAQDADPSVQERACYALDAFCESLDKEILPFMPQLMERLLGVLQTSSSHDMQDSALSAIASTVAAAGKDVAPYAPTLLPVLQHYMSLTQHDAVPCRCRATECAGLVLEGLGISGSGPEARALLAAAAPGFMQAGLQGFQVAAPAADSRAGMSGSAPAVAGVSELREYGHGMFACVAKALGQEFAPYLQYVLPLALQSCALDDGTFADGEGEEEGGDGEGGAAAGAGTGPLGDISDDEAGARGTGKSSFSIRTGILDEKCCATAALGQYAESCPQAVAPHLEATLAAVTTMANYFHEEVRAVAYCSLAQLVIAGHTLWPPPPGMTVGGAGPAPVGGLSTEVARMAAVAMPALLEGLEDGDKHATAAAFGAVMRLLQRVGVAVVGSGAGGQAQAEGMGRVAEAAAAVLAGKAACHEDDGEESDGEEESGGNVEAEEELLAAACDLLPALAAAAGPSAYAPVFDALHLPGLLGRLKPRQPEDLRAVAVGALAEVAEILQARLSPHLDKLMPPLLRELRGADAVNRQNAAFCCGVLAEGCGTAMRPYYQQLLQALHPLFGTEEDNGTRDNATGAVARLLLAAGGELPLEQVVPVFLKGLPLRDDMQEALVVYKALGKLTTSAETAPRMLPLAHDVVRAFAAACVQPGLPPDALREVGNALQALQAQYPQQVQGLMATLPAEQQAAAARVVAGCQGASR